MKFAAPDGALAVKLETLPNASTLAPGTHVYILPDDARSRGFLGAFTRKRLSRSVRCNALLLAGYTRIACEHDVVTASA